MADVITLNVQTRDRAGKGAARATRQAGLVPGVIYGDKKEPTLIAMDPRELKAQMVKIGFWTQLYEIDLGGTKHRTLARDLQFDPVTDAPIHVDFLRVGQDTKITVAVPVRFLNEDISPGLKKGGVLNVVRHDVDLICKADAIPECLTVDLAKVDLNESIHYSAVTGGENAKPTITDRDFTIATIAAPSGLKSDKAGGEEGEEGEEEAAEA